MELTAEQQKYFANQDDFNDADHSFIVHSFVDNGAVSWYRRFLGEYRMVSSEHRRTTKLANGVRP